MKVGYKKKDETGDTGEEILAGEIDMSLMGHGCAGSIGVVAYHKGDAKHKTPPLLLLEWASGGDLLKTRLDFMSAMYRFQELFQCLEDLHRSDVVHFDIKPENLLLTSNGHLRVADFGLAQPKKEAAEFLGEESSGSPGFEAPECVLKTHAKKLLGKQCDKVDVWAAGMCVAAILGVCKQYPFDMDDKDVMLEACEKVEDEKIQVLNLNSDLRVSNKLLREFFLKTLTRNAADRFTAKQAKAFLGKMIAEFEAMGL